MRTASTIVAVNRDPDAPIADFADLFVVGDLFEVGQAILERAARPVGLSGQGADARRTSSVLLPIVAFIALAAGLAIVLRRAGRIVARTREVEHFRTAVRDLAARIDTSLDGAAGRIDAVRRGQGRRRHDRETVEAATTPSRATPTRPARSEGPPEADAIRTTSCRARARRARARDGRARRLDPGHRSAAGRELEAQTSIKRGYLNLLHAREAIARALEAEALDATSATAQASRRSPPDPERMARALDHTM